MNQIRELFNKFGPAIVLSVLILSLSLDYYFFRQRVPVETPAVSGPITEEAWVDYEVTEGSPLYEEQKTTFMRACEDGINFIGEVAFQSHYAKALAGCETVFIDNYVRYEAVEDLQHRGCASGLRLGFRYTDHSRVVEFDSLAELLKIYCTYPRRDRP